jgi:hypoxanthine phosphoribosyltransferase
MEGLDLLFSEDEIRAAVESMARSIEEDHADKELLVIAVLKGSFIFLADLVRRIRLPLEIDFIWLSSYGMERYSSGEVRIRKDLDASVTGRHVLLVEDIVDTGLTIRFLQEHLEKRGPASISLCALLDKRIRRKLPVEFDYTGFVVEEGFLVGYGLDDGERFRHLPAIYRRTGS